VVSTLRSITSVWRSSWNSKRFHFDQSQHKHCNTAVAGSFKRSTDFLCYEKIIIEIKAASALVDEHRAQVLNYLTATGCKLGLLVNFGHYPRVKDERLLARGTRSSRSSSLKFSRLLVYFVGK
jgi:hypothetical protein